MSANLSGRGIGHAFGDLTVLDGIDLAVEAGQVLAVVGPSGCGKSTLLELIAGLQQPGTGTIDVAGEVAPQRRLAHCAYMPQTDCLLPWYSALDNAALGLMNAGLARTEARRRAGELFERFGLTGFEGSRPRDLSGGMRQRVAFLRTLLAGKDVLLLDEPFAALDAITRAELQEWLLPALRDGGHTAVLVTHDVEEALYLGDRVAVMSPRPGRIVETVEAPHPPAEPRRQVVTSPGFVSLRERVMASLTTGSAPAGGASR